MLQTYWYGIRKNRIVLFYSLFFLKRLKTGLNIRVNTLRLEVIISASPFNPNSYFITLFAVV